MLEPVNAASRTSCATPFCKRVRISLRFTQNVSLSVGWRFVQDISPQQQSETTVCLVMLEESRAIKKMQK